MRDKITGKYVVAGSFHWPTSSFHWPTSHRKGPPCAYENAREAGARLGAGAASLRILGGDANATDTAGGGKWSLLINGGYPGVSGESTVTFDSGDRADRAVTGHDRSSLSYSDHRAIKARIHY